MIFNNPTEAFECHYDSIMRDGIDFANTKALFNVNFGVDYNSFNNKSIKTIKLFLKVVFW